jgi:signal peptide peptidase SppA
MSRAHLLALMQEPMALERRAFQALVDVLARGDSNPLELAADSPLRAARKTPAGSFGGNIAIIGVYGFLTSRPNIAEWLFPACCTSTQSISAQLRAALADDSIGCVILDFDSPGGGVYGVSELADEIFAARAVKPVLGISQHLAASAAFWLASQCANFYASPSSEAGSIGVLAVHEDWSKFNDRLGMKRTYVYAGQFKTELNPDAPPTQEAIDYQQSRIDSYYSAFVKAVARGRKASVADVRSKMGQGRILGAQDAIAANLACGVKTFSQVVEQARAAAKGGPKLAAALTAPISGMGMQGLRNSIALIEASGLNNARIDVAATRRWLDLEIELCRQEQAAEFDDD